MKCLDELMLHMGQATAGGRSVQAAGVFDKLEPVAIGHAQVVDAARALADLVRDCGYPELTGSDQLRAVEELIGDGGPA
ncbi:MAG: hypothetical protein GY711_11470 [bacterium]|nr:hypothetical protein [bacterium]